MELEETATPAEIDDRINEMSDILDEKFGKSWMIWRAVGGHWCFRGKLNEQQCEARGDGIYSAMVAAYDWEALPLVPPEVRILIYDAFTPVKVSSSAWRLTYDGVDCCVRFKTKKEALEYAQKRVQESEVNRAKWLDKYGWTLHKREGQDFRTSDQVSIED